MRQRIVAFGHRKGTGKDTAASFAVERPQGLRSQVNSIVDRMYDGGKHA